MNGRLRLAIACATWLAAAPASATTTGPWALPEAGRCGAAVANDVSGEDAAALPFAPGDVLTFEEITRLRSFVPEGIWTYRERFFYEGMRLEVGPCFRDYAPPDFFDRATRELAGRARLLESGGLDGHVAGLPFPPETIDPEDPHAGMRWAWNFALRYEGAGFRGDFRVSDLVGRVGRAEPFEGEIFKMRLTHRADRAADGYRVPFARGNEWVSGGLFFAPFNAREYAWRQYRNVEHQAEPGRSDDLHAWIPWLRRVRRISASQAEGIHMPSFSVGVKGSTSGAIQGVGGTLGSGEVTGTTGTIVTRRSGFEGMVMRPHLYDVRLVGVRDVIAPINAQGPMYPESPEREFGPWGLSFASDRWDLRRALVLECARRSPAGREREYRILLFVDLQTLHPLYYMSYDPDGEPIDVAMFVGRWSEDRADYPRWPDDPERPVHVIDSVGAAFANLGVKGSWRRESWDVVSVPPPDRELKKQLSVNELTKRR